MIKEDTFLLNSVTKNKIPLALNQCLNLLYLENLPNWIKKEGEIPTNLEWMKCTIELISTTTTKRVSKSKSKVMRKMDARLIQLLTRCSNQRNTQLRQDMKATETPNKFTPFFMSKLPLGHQGRTDRSMR